MYGGKPGPGSYGYGGPPVGGGGAPPPTGGGGGGSDDDYDSDPAGYDSYGSMNYGGDSSDEEGIKDLSAPSMPKSTGSGYGGYGSYGSYGGYGSDGSDKDKEVIKKSTKPSLSIWRKEVDVGVTEFCGAHKGFFAIIKQRVKDFHVNEINVQEEVIHLTDEAVPEQPTEKGKGHIVPEGAPACITEEKISEMDLMFGVNSKVSNDVVMSEKDKKDEKILHEVLIKVDGLGKEERTSIHLFIKSQYKKVLTAVKEINNEKYIQVRRGIADDRWNKKSPWPKLQRYTHFVMYKEDMDTIEAIKKIAERTRSKPAMYSFADYKDKRAKTSQLVSVPEVRPHRLYSATKDNWAIKVGNFSFQQKPLQLGQFSGNKFRVVLRKIAAGDEVVNKAVESFKNTGFINYYGMHRFGTTSDSPLGIGKALIQGNWSEVIKVILTPSSEFYGEHYFMNMALKEYHTNGNAKEALAKLNEYGKTDSLGAKLLQGLSECDKDDLVGAINRIPQGTRSQYVHAYQSFVWNSIASKRIKEFGLRVLPGDLVWRHPSNSSKEKILEDTYETILAEDSTTVFDTEREETKNKDSEKKINVDIHRLTAEEANKTNITEIVLPLPGHDILLPENEIKDWYQEMLEKDSISFERLKDDMKSYTLNGVYRHLLVRPSDVIHSITYYNDHDKPLIQSDKEKLKGEDVEKNKLEPVPEPEPMDVDQKEKSEGVNDGSNPVSSVGAYGGVPGGYGSGGYGSGPGGFGGYGGYGYPKIDPTKGKMKALLFEMTLPPSSYPSMALRELLKIDTSSQFQNILDPANAKMKLGRGRQHFGRRGRGRGRRGRGKRGR